MRILTAAICDHAGADAGGKLDLQGVFHDLYAPGFPAQQGRMMLVLVLEWDRGDNGRFDFQIDVRDPAGNLTLSVDGYSEVSARPADRPPPRTRLMMPLQDVVFPVPGPYEFDLKVKGRVLSGPTLYLTEMDESDEQAPR
ncbi:MAG: hypothetical protein HKO77_06920 [Gemmatimonadetes bacterium]|nr:hypothetical protein [Gemmatimonadota bacterium]NNL30736.1 hypothetical protein [Gemmatimonadota bacterium]NNM32552.1 hypothetical protein [Gemmatimonadota bacterium]